MTRRCFGSRFEDFDDDADVFERREFAEFADGCDVGGITFLGSTKEGLPFVMVVVEVLPNIEFLSD